MPKPTEEIKQLIRELEESPAGEAALNILREDPPNFKL